VISVIVERDNLTRRGNARDPGGGNPALSGRGSEG